MKALKELRLGVETNAGVSAHVKPRYNIVRAGPSDSADSTFSSRMSNTFNDDEHSEEEMSDHILRKRIKINGKYSLNNTLENVNEGPLQIAADLAKGIPGLDQIVGNTELIMQSAQAKEALTGLHSIVKSLAVSSGTSAFNIAGTDADFQRLLHVFSYATIAEKETLKVGIEKIIDVIKNMIITAAMTFDTLAAIPAFLGGPTGPIAEILINVSTTAGTLLRGVPVERFIFQMTTDRTGIVSKFIDAITTLLTAGGLVGKLFGKIVGMASDKGGEIIEMFFSEPQELLRRLGDLYKAASSNTYQDNMSQMIAKNAYGYSDDKISDLNQMSMNENKKYSILFLLEGFEKELSTEKKGFTDKYDNHKKLKGKQKKGLPDHLQKVIIGSKKNEIKDEEESFEEIDLEEFSGSSAVAGYALPQPGPNPNKSNTKKAQTSHHKLLEKQMNEQIERMRMLEAYHHKTTNKLK